MRKIWTTPSATRHVVSTLACMLSRLLLQRYLSSFAGSVRHLWLRGAAPAAAPRTGDVSGIAASDSESQYCPLDRNGDHITCKRTSHANQSLQTTDDDCYSQHTKS